MKKILLILGIVLLLLSCSNDDKYITINGRVERILNGEGIPNQTVSLNIRQAHGSGQYGTYYTDIESKKVTTDLNGNFSVTVKSVDRMFVEVFKSQDENYSTFELKSFNPTDNIIVGVHKFVKFKIYVKNTSPFDENDYVSVHLVSGNVQNFVEKIENFGIQNIISPIYLDTSWKGINVNSIIYYNVPENAEEYNIVYYKTKNAVNNTVVINNIPFQTNQINEFNLNY